MKSKKLTILLICAVTAVWGIIIHRILFNDESGGYQPVFTNMKQLDEPIDQYFIREDTNTLVLTYRDPFLGEVYSEPKQVIDNSQAFVAVPVKAEPIPINWPAIQYSGYISNSINKNRISIVSVNGKERMIAEGEVFADVKLVKNEEDSILVEWEGNRKHIKQ